MYKYSGGLTEMNKLWIMSELHCPHNCVLLRHKLAVWHWYILDMKEFSKEE